MESLYSVRGSGSRPRLNLSWLLIIQSEWKHLWQCVLFKLLMNNTHTAHWKMDSHTHTHIYIYTHYSVWPSQRNRPRSAVCRRWIIVSVEMFDNFVTLASRLNQSIWTLCLMILVLVILVFPVLFWNCTLVCCMSLFSSSLASPHLSFSRLTPPPVPDLLVGVSVWNGKQKKKKKPCKKYCKV